ncbi:hypothetical protein [Solihabitans fulvus]|uniref:hypothetical protein n=1 Tax=Solihabitans fulvus TaxID=1892852 RepID=UPI001661F3FC|nr:hypothetical protein [Solihabitans fulvus]
MNTKKVVVLAVVALALFLLITRPQESASGVHNVLNGLKQGAEAILTFIKSLFA